MTASPHSTQALTTSIHCTFAGHGRDTSWTYAADQPHAIKVSIPDQDDVVVIWEFARSLLTHLTRPAGLGDVVLEPINERTTAVRLSSPDGTAELWFDTEDLRQFRNQTYALCIPGQEPEPDLSSVENVLRAAAEHAGGDW
jgi:hypothetical protein